MIETHPPELEGAKTVNSWIFLFSGAPTSPLKPTSPFHLPQRLQVCPNKPPVWPPPHRRPHVALLVAPCANRRGAAGGSKGSSAAEWGKWWRFRVSKITLRSSVRCCCFELPRIRTFQYKQPWNSSRESFVLDRLTDLLKVESWEGTSNNGSGDVLDQFASKKTRVMR